jgi:hypothetical protein
LTSHGIFQFMAMPISQHKDQHRANNDKGIGKAARFEIHYPSALRVARTRAWRGDGAPFKGHRVGELLTPRPSIGAGACKNPDARAKPATTLWTAGDRFGHNAG